MSILMNAHRVVYKTERKNFDSDWFSQNYITRFARKEPWFNTQQRNRTIGTVNNNTDYGGCAGGDDDDNAEYYTFFLKVGEHEFLQETDDTG